MIDHNAETVFAASPSQVPSPLTVVEVLRAVWRNRRLVLGGSFLVFLVVLAVNFFLLPLSYKATASLLPEADKSRTSMVSQFAGLATLAGVALPSGDVARLYPTIVTSDIVLRNTVLRRYASTRFPDSLTLLQYWELDDPSLEKNVDEALRRMRDLLTATHDSKTNVVMLSLEMREPALAANVLNTIIDELDVFMRQKKTSSASEQARWIGDRIRQVEEELRQSEENLKEFRERNRRVGDSPELLLRQERLLREVTVKSAIFTELKKQHELARIEEIKNVTVVNVLDRATPPVRKEHPRRGVNSALAFLGSFVCLAGYVVSRPRYGDRVRAMVRQIRGLS